MITLDTLWLPILLSSVIVFVVSSVIHMALPWHKNDYSKVPNEDKVMDALRPFAIPPGDYMLPRVSSTKEMQSPEFIEKLKKGPVMMLTVWPNGPTTMGRISPSGFSILLLSGSSRRTSPGAHCPPARRILRSSGLLEPRPSSDMPWRSGRCRSGTAALGARRSKSRWTA